MTATVVPIVVAALGVAAGWRHRPAADPVDPADAADPADPAVPADVVVPPMPHAEPDPSPS